MITAIAITIPEASYFSCEHTSSFFALTSSIWSWTAAILASNCAWHLPSALGRDTSGSYSVVGAYDFPGFQACRLSILVGRLRAIVFGGR